MFNYVDPVTGQAIVSLEIDPFDPAYASDPEKLYAELEDHINSAARRDLLIMDENSEITKMDMKCIYLHVPEYTPPDSWPYLYRAVSYGKKMGVSVFICKL